jgi:hypothetical protein
MPHDDRVTKLLDRTVTQRGHEVEITKLTILERVAVILDARPAVA